MDKFKVQLEAWGPFAEGKNSFFENPVLLKIAAKYNRTVAQIGLRFLVQSGIIAIPKSSHIKRMEENISVFDFEISNSDMSLIRMLDTGRSAFCDHSDPEFVQAVADLSHNHP